jgi:hypothetical protein
MEFFLPMHLQKKSPPMKTLITSSFLVLMIAFCDGQPLKETELKTTIKEVTVFLDAAQIFETGAANITTGKSLVRVKRLSPFIDEKSIQVKAEGEFTILSVNHKFNYIDALKKNEIIDSLKKVKNDFQSKINVIGLRQQVLEEKYKVMDENRKVAGQNGVGVAQLKQTMDFYERELTAIKDEELKLRRQASQLTAQQQTIDRQLKEEQDRKILPTSEVEIRVDGRATGTGKFSLTYLVANAGWFPKYDVRVKDINSPLSLSYKAEVFQNTGVDWKSVKLRFSNGTPNQSGVAPQLPDWRLTYARNTVMQDVFGDARRAPGTVRGRVQDENGEGAPGVNVVIKGTTIGTVTDANGNYSLTLPNMSSTLVFSFIGYTTQEIRADRPEVNVTLMADQAMLSEVVVTGYTSVQRRDVTGSVVRVRGIKSSAAANVITTVIENQTTVEIAVDEPYTINSDGEKLSVDLKQYAIPASYEYYAVPKIDKDAFLIAQITDWDQYNLLEGEANLYFEDAFIGRSILNAKTLNDTLNISLGRDKSIVIARTKIDEFSKTKTIGTNTTDTRAFRITVRNRKSQPIKLNILDQIPVSIVDDITVETKEFSGGRLDEKTGKVTWSLTIEPTQQKELLLKYEVKYPRRESVILE